MKLTFKEYLLQEAKYKSRKKGNRYPVKGAKKVVDPDIEKTDKAYRGANSLRSTVSGVGGMGGF